MNKQDLPNFGPAARYRVKEHLVRNVYREFHEQQTCGQRVADYVAKVVGSWPFIICQSVIIAVWMGVNAYLVYMKVFDPDYFNAWDPYPFILLNLVLSFQAAYTGPVVMMSQNRQAEKDRVMAEQDYQINKKSAEEIEVIMAHLVHQDEFMNQLMARLEKIERTVEKV
ncbi:MAG: hypothetical protein K0R22_2007 [Sporomusa sp.]|jgi:uncharacterized membrane protein|nr:hypothetical protein [Sporomusa sp.]